MPKDKKTGERRLSPYNKFMKTELARVKSEHPDMNHRDAFKQAAHNWKNSPDNPKNGSSDRRRSIDRSSPNAEPPRAAVATDNTSTEIHMSTSNISPILVQKKIIVNRSLCRKDRTRPSIPTRRWLRIKKYPRQQQCLHIPHSVCMAALASQIY
ncbi:hypothetical protein BDF19DRAFT_406124 [Syncephalis fuscata]|nr:hypothetical protein BDF19DRAFT_406124 [Syncephalis fuscata]